MTGRIRKLRGFQKHHHVPDNTSDAARSFVRNTGHEDIKILADGLFRDIRKSFGYKRREFDYSCDAGEAWVKTPDFDASITIDQSDEIPKDYLITTELPKLHNQAIAGDPRLHSCFNAHCDALVVSFPTPIQFEDKINAIEDMDTLAYSMTDEPDGSRFELKLSELDLCTAIDACAMHFSLLTLRNLGKLIEQSQRAFEILTDCGFGLRIGPQRSVNAMKGRNSPDSRCPFTRTAHLPQNHIFEE